MKTERFNFKVPDINCSMKNENIWNQPRVLRKGTEKTRLGKKGIRIHRKEGRWEERKMSRSDGR